MLCPTHHEVSRNPDARRLGPNGYWVGRTNWKRPMLDRMRAVDRTRLLLRAGQSRAGCRGTSMPAQNMFKQIAVKGIAFKNILLATDFSVISKQALHYAASFACRYGSRLYL